MAQGSTVFAWLILRTGGLTLQWSQYQFFILDHGAMRLQDQCGGVDMAENPDETVAWSLEI